MTRYQTILLDVDETLLNFEEGQDKSLVKLFKDQGLELTEKIRAEYKKKTMPYGRL